MKDSQNESNFAKFWKGAKLLYSARTIADFVFVLLFLFFLSFYVYLVLKNPDMLNDVSHFLFQAINLGIACYLSYRLTIKSAKDRVIEGQKAIARTSLRQIRGSQLIISNIMTIVRSKNALFKEAKVRMTLEDLINHLENLGINISSADAAFKDILGEELKEDSQNISDYRIAERQLNIKQNEIERLKEEVKKKGEKEEETEKQIIKLDEEIDELRKKQSNYITSSPFLGSTVDIPLGSFSSPSFSLKSPFDTLSLQDDYFRGILGKDFKVQDLTQKKPPDKEKESEKKAKKTSSKKKK